jgi:hypothetical protein
MGRISKIKRLLIEEANKKLLGEQYVPEPTVGAIQQFLIDVGVLPKLNKKGESNVDGIPGEATAKAVGDYLLGFNNDVRTIEDLRKKLEAFTKIVDGVPHPGTRKGWGDLMSKSVSTAIEMKQKGVSFFTENKESFNDYITDPKYQPIILKLMNRQLPGNENKSGDINSSTSLHRKDYSKPVGIHKCDDCPLCGYATFNYNPCDLGYLNYETSATLNQITFKNVDVKSFTAFMDLNSSIYVKDPWKIFKDIDIESDLSMNYTVTEDVNNYYLKLEITFMENTTTSWEDFGVGYLRLYNNKLQYQNKTINKLLKAVNLPKLVISSDWKHVSSRIKRFIKNIDFTINKKEIGSIVMGIPYNPSKDEKKDINTKIINTTTKNTKITGEKPKPPPKNVFRTLYNTNNTPLKG